MKYYLIHGVDSSRKQHMLNEFQKAGINNDDVQWIEGNNKDDLSAELIASIMNKEDRHCCGVLMPAGGGGIRRGQISCSYKHYLALKDMVENGYEYCVIMEDNMAFAGTVPAALDRYLAELNTYYPDWDALFDCYWNRNAHYIEGPVTPDRVVYLKSNMATNQCLGSSKLAQFYLLNKRSAKLLYENYLPILQSPDWHMNELFRKFNSKVFWVEPANVVPWQHESTA